MAERGFDNEQYLGLVASISGGKRLPDALYLHVDALPTLPEPLQHVVRAAEALLPSDERWNVLKLGTERCKLSFLWYPTFFEDGFPLLQSSWSIDLRSRACVKRDYEPATAPVLHRKERMLPPGHPATTAASELTREAEELGLLDDSRHIGTRVNWEAKLQRVGLRVVRHRLVSIDETSTESVTRHRTALTRYSLSTPVQSLWRHGFLDGTLSFFDYGCGKGDDVRGLASIGVSATGWDPHFAADNPKQAADVVNLGFVLNVIEDQRERLEALRGAWALTGRVLVVAVLIGGRSAFERFRLFRDGVLTGRGTFQKYFTTDEFREYLEEALAREPITVTPGIAYVFRNDDDEQAFLARRTRARPAIVPRISASQPEGEREAREPRPVRVRSPSKWEAHSELADEFWACCLSLARLPERDEYPRLDEVREALGSPGTVFRALLRRRGEEAFRTAQEARRNDLSVFLALNLFERRRSFRGLAEQIQRDIRAHFGNYQTAQAVAQELLFSTGKPAVILEAAQRSAAGGLGFLDGEHSLQLHSSLAQELPPVLRVYLGCAARLYGDVDTADVVKLHVRSGKVSIMVYDDFEGKPLPRLIERVKINLRRQEITFFEYGAAEANEQLLYLKSRFIRRGFPNYDEQLAFDRDLVALGYFSFDGFGPPVAEFQQALAKANATIDGFSLVRQ
jgi:DNA phosphorothioation-associated putative methyltransferase